MNDERFTGPLQATFKDAVFFIGQSLPNKLADKHTVLPQALSLLDCAGESAEKDQASRDLAKLVRLSPQCYGLARKKGYWRIVLKALTREEATVFYLRQFPPEITHNQHTGLYKYLTENLGMDPDSALTQLSRFKLKLAVGISLIKQMGRQREQFGFVH